MMATRPPNIHKGHGQDRHYRRKMVTVLMMKTIESSGREKQAIQQLSC